MWVDDEAGRMWKEKGKKENVLMYTGKEDVGIGRKRGRVGGGRGNVVAFMERVGKKSQEKQEGVWKGGGGKVGRKETL